MAEEGEAMLFLSGASGPWVQRVDRWAFQAVDTFTARPPTLAGRPHPHCCVSWVGKCPGS